MICWKGCSRKASRVLSGPRVGMPQRAPLCQEGHGLVGMTPLRRPLGRALDGQDVSGDTLALGDDASGPFPIRQALDPVATDSPVRHHGSGGTPARLNPHEQPPGHPMAYRPSLFPARWWYRSCSLGRW